MQSRIPLREISARKDELEKCVGCGLCQAVCSTYIVTGHESTTARGKITLLKGLLDGRIEPTSRLADIFDDCLTCYACQTVCPAEVKTEKLWTSARQDLRSFSTTSTKKRFALNWSIAKPRLLEKVIRMLAFVFGFNPESTPHSTFAGRRIPISRSSPYIERLEEEYLPTCNQDVRELEKTPKLSFPRRRESRENNNKMDSSFRWNDKTRHSYTSYNTIGTVALLVGCSNNYITPWIIDSTISVLTSAGWKVVIPPEQVCCGAPAINNGEWKTARKLARRNIEIFNRIGADYITSPDATCASAFSKDYMELFVHEPSTMKDAEDLSVKTVELGSLIYRTLKSNTLRFKPIKRRIAVHESCHVRHLGGENRYREILSTINQLEIVDLDDKELCCGFGGSYTVFHKQASDRIARRKLERMIESKADEVLVGSPGCLIRLLSVLPEGIQKRINIRHAIELLDEAIN